MSGLSVERPPKRLSPLTPLVRGFILVLAVLVSSWDDLLRGDLGPFAWILIAVLVAGAVFGVASWLRTSYWIEADELRVDTGLVSRQSRRIRVDRLQGIDINQPFVARLFGLAELKLDVAGGGDKEGSLAFVTLGEAHDLRRTLLARRDAVRAGDHDPEGHGTVGHAPRAPHDEPETVVARLDLPVLVVSLLLAPETVGLVLSTVALVVVLMVFGQLGGAGGLLTLAVGFALTRFRRLSAYYGFTVSTTGEAGGAPERVQVHRGLFERTTQTVSLARVQGVVVVEPLLWRGLGWARLDVSVAGAAHADNDGSKPSASTVMPVAARAEVLALARTLLADAGGPDPDAVALRPAPRRARWVAPVRRRFLAGGVGEQLVVSREGLLSQRTHVVPHARVQSLQVRQGPWQRRLGLADLQVDSPPGPVAVRLRHREALECRRLLDREQSLARAARRPQPAVSRPGPPVPRPS